jgi:hypothetical protein
MGGESNKASIQLPELHKRTILQTVLAIGSVTV